MPLIELSRRAARASLLVLLGATLTLLGADMMFLRRHLGLLLARTRRYWIYTAVPLAWLLTTLLFLVIDLVLVVQVRYFYFALPLMLVIIALMPGRLAAQGRWARLVACSLV